MESDRNLTIGDLAVLIGKILVKHPQQDIRVEVHFKGAKHTQICTFIGAPEVLLKVVIDDVNGRVDQTIKQVKIDIHGSEAPTASPKDPESKGEQSSQSTPAAQSSFQQAMSGIAQRVIESDTWTKLTDHVVDYGVKKFTENLIKSDKKSDSADNLFNQARNNALDFLNLIIRTLRDDKSVQEDNFSRAMELIKGISESDSPDKYKEKVQNIVDCLKELCQHSNLYPNVKEVSLRTIQSCFMAQVKS